MDKKLLSKDGSYTYFSHLFGECYHSLKDGAYNETLHKYIYPPFYFCDFQNKPLRILDLCFGLGYNSSLAAKAYHDYPNSVCIIAPEIDRGVLEKISTLNCNFTKEQLHILAQEKPLWLAEQICLQVPFGDALEIIPGLERFDIIYLDAFSLKSTPQFWNKEFFALLYAILEERGIMMSYSTHAKIYENARESGFRVYKYKNHFCRKSSIFTKAISLTSPNLLEIF
ncbi:MnmC family methyltransferase [Helicobacter mustelae]|uniref:MnmC-like methyltransferase domain-containing protein n=1 Tax=Helicobacter mustelae (strain ATCC 43772 / CCUG 25715 / CIP 103759 / LMG 18044 / NCTC 12198 / R85-136P) TaxID=679897 RepID=D3UHN5_HELM1|nr:MnmC family methyltransferase [Helicobacter mustelae]CBG40007.1 Putative hypothetical protein [Helicobacter mustelae 12198]SQH71519.1 bifunctional tRNA (mnm(5)s(2)U34)-methyltransferase/FAD-dependent cmnm(5)s(2)U34 oxidoreductase [Helicobacter mustelae]STP12644.1 bifunctional tRNA (mnm(5)s(2)U34)-methyltransferase/FAD-dependent cmnm(5)s(2)U34 oxidoreductase [Helicobacter mustelae]